MEHGLNNTKRVEAAGRLPLTIKEIFSLFYSINFFHPPLTSFIASSILQPFRTFTIPFAINPEASISNTINPIRIRILLEDTTVPATNNTIIKKKRTTATATTILLLLLLVA